MIGNYTDYEEIDAEMLMKVTVLYLYYHVHFPFLVLLEIIESFKLDSFIL